MKIYTIEKTNIFSIFKTILFVLMAISSTGCASISGSVSEEINNRRTEYALIKHEGQTVVFENGLGGRLGWWGKVFPEVSKEASVFAYNRPGYGQSEPATTPRDGIHVVEELRAILKAKQLNPPYVLVGHSLGGLYMQLYARKYPNEVKALVLVDSTHPDQMKGDGASKNWPWWFMTYIDWFNPSVVKEELDLIDSTGEMVLSLPAFDHKPVYILSALQPLQVKSKLADDSNAKRRDLARLYPNAFQIWVDSGHAIPLEKPEEIVKAIHAALNPEGREKRADGEGRLN